MSNYIQNHSVFFHEFFARKMIFYDVVLGENSIQVRGRKYLFPIELDVS